MSSKKSKPAKKARVRKPAKKARVRNRSKKVVLSHPGDADLPLTFRKRTPDHQVGIRLKTSEAQELRNRAIAADHRSLSDYIRHELGFPPRRSL